jgi:hypothetical protein
MRLPNKLVLLPILVATSSLLLNGSPPPEVRAQQPKPISGARQSDTDGRRVGESIFRVTVSELAAEDRSLDKQHQKGLRVTWGKPRRVAGSTDHAPHLAISGKLSLLQADGKTLKPVDWPLPIRVVMCPRPNEKPDWRRWHDLDTLASDHLVGRELVIGARSTGDGGSEPIPLPKKPPGTFLATFSLRQIQSPIGATKPFQVGLCLGEKKGTTVTWRNLVPIQPQTVQLLEVSGPRPLSRTLQLINACPNPLGWRFDGIALARAVNHLSSLGKDNAIAAMREFLEMADHDGYGRDGVDPANIDTSDQYCLACVVPLVFDRVDLLERITVWQGIPFHTVVIDGFRGQRPRSTGRLLDRAAQSGKLFAQPLRPADNPLPAADSLFDRIVPPKEPEMSRLRLREHLRKQAWRAVRHLVDPRAKAPPDLSSQANWDRLNAKVAQLKIRWDEKRQEYVAAAKPK